MWWMFDRGRLEKQRTSLLQTVVDNSALYDYLQCPFPDFRRQVGSLSFLALDFETTGLDARKEAILSVGYTVIDQQRVQLGQSGHQIIKINRDIPPTSISLHGITDDRVREGKHLHDVIDKQLLPLMQKRILLVHYQEIERSFLQAYFKNRYGHEIPLLMLDTLVIEQRYRHKHGVAYSNNDLRLFNLRRAYGLPRYKAHNAMFDAIATAELFLAQMAHRNQPRLTDLMSL